MRKELQKQSFADFLQNRCSWKFRKFHRKISMLESLFNKAAELKTCNFIKKRLQHRCFSLKFAKFLRTLFLQNTSSGHFWNQTHASAAVLLHIRTGNFDWNESHKEKMKHIHASGADLLHVRIGNIDCCKRKHCKNEARETDFLCCREVNAMLIASAKILFLV